MATLYDITGMVVSSDTTSLIATLYDIASMLEWGDTTAILATQYFVTSQGYITGVTAGDGLHGTSTHDAAPASAGGLQILSDSLAVKILGTTITSAFGGIAVDTSIIGTKYDDTQLITAVTAGVNAQQGGTSGAAVVDVVPGSAGGLEGLNDSLQVKLNGATLTRGFAGMAVEARRRHRRHRAQRPGNPAVPAPE